MWFALEKVLQEGRRGKEERERWAAVSRTAGAKAYRKEIAEALKSEKGY